MPKNKRRNKDVAKQMANTLTETHNKLNRGDAQDVNLENSAQTPAIKSPDVPCSPIEEKLTSVIEDKKPVLQTNGPLDSSKQEVTEKKHETVPRNKESHENSQRRGSPSSSNTNNGSSKTNAGQVSNSGVAKTGLERSLKDLSRQISSLKRIELRIESEIENSMKRLKKAFQDVRKMLDEREVQLEQEMHKAKEDARKLIAQRQQQAADLKVRVDNIAVLDEPSITELRADIKHFVVERKYDEELASMTIFMWDKDKITEDIQRFAEVIPVKNHYSQRCNSASSSSQTSSAEGTNANGYKTPEVGAGDDLNSADQEQTSSAATVTRPTKRSEGGRARVFSNRGRYNNANVNSNSSSQMSYDHPQGGSAPYRKDNGGNRWQNNGHQRQSWSHYNGDYHRGGNGRNAANQDGYGRADRGGRGNRGQNGERFPHRRDSYSNRGPRGANSNRVLPNRQQGEDPASAKPEEATLGVRSTATAAESASVEK